MKVHTNTVHNHKSQNTELLVFYLSCTVTLSYNYRKKNLFSQNCLEYNRLKSENTMSIPSARKILFTFITISMKGEINKMIKYYFIYVLLCNLIYRNSS